MQTDCSVFMAVCDEAATTIQATALTKARWEAWQRLHLFELFGVTGRDGCITQGCHLKGYSRTESVNFNGSLPPGSINSLFINLPRPRYRSNRINYSTHLHHQRIVQKPLDSFAFLLVFSSLIDSFSSWKVHHSLS
ncbi:hypothetical protein KEM48_010328 [Puccinia striiformis f. sp. tritici PST-130]|nr:hypothetical protein H4Q26_010957 [Puccinia striiformis f. sp. tritici PST-130]KAI9626502.1 hypothetical protein KEM48_010328 [Puccinia striiformis f. sp. tritici PST-130]